MTDRQNQLQLDRLAMKYLTAVEAGDFDAIEALWALADADAELADMLHGLNAELAADYDRATSDEIAGALVGAIERHMPSAEVIRPVNAPVTAATVAEYLRKHPPGGLTADEWRLNDALRASAEELPPELGVPQVVAWGRRFGAAPEAYWRAFRVAALELLMRADAPTDNYQMAARPTKPKPAEGNS